MKFYYIIKKLTSLILIFAMVFLLFSCNTKDNTNQMTEYDSIEQNENSDKINVTIYYSLPDYIYNNKNDLFIDFFSNFYDFILNTNGGKSNLEFNGIHSQKDALMICKTWDNNNSLGLPNVGFVYGPYFFDSQIGSKMMDHKDENSFIGYCLQNDKFIDFLYFIKTFFYYWRLDEGYTTETNHGSDFFASSFSSVVDVAKFFYFDKNNLPDYFYARRNIPRLYDMIPGVLNTPFVLINEIEFDSTENIKYILEDKIDCYGFKIDGYYLSNDFSGTEYSFLTYDDVQDIINSYSDNLDDKDLSSNMIKITLYPKLSRVGRFADEIYQDLLDESVAP